MATKPLQPPRWGDPFVDKVGAPLQWPQAWIDEVTRVVNTDLSDLSALKERVTENEDDLADHESRITVLETPRTISFQNADYTITETTESGVVANHATGVIEVMLIDADLIADMDFFVQNASANGTVHLLTQDDQTISGVDLLLIEPQVPFPLAQVKSDGANWILIADRVGNYLKSGFYWADDLAEKIVTDTGEEIVWIDHG